jgi:hypothetical protein
MFLGVTPQTTVFVDGSEPTLHSFYTIRDFSWRVRDHATALRLAVPGRTTRSPSACASAS